jgi:hypothetical protein
MVCFRRKHEDNSEQSQTNRRIDSRIARFADNGTLIIKFLGILSQPALRNLIRFFR